MDNQPIEILKNIISFVPPQYYHKLALVNKKFKQILDDSSILSPASYILTSDYYHFKKLNVDVVSGVIYPDEKFANAENLTMYLFCLATFMKNKIFLKYFGTIVNRPTEIEREIIHGCACYGDIDVFDFLFKNQKSGLFQKITNVFGTSKTFVQKHGEFALGEFASNGNLEIVKWLISQGTDINCLIELKRSVTISLKYLRSPPFHSNPLYGSIYRYHFDVSKFLIENGADVNYFENIILARAINEYYVEMIKYFIENKTYDQSTLNKQFRKHMESISFYETDKHSKQFAMIKLFLTNGTNLNDIPVDKSDKIIKESCRYGDAEMIKLLIERGYDIRLHGQWILIECIKIAIEHDRLEMAKLLIKHGENGEFVLKQTDDPNLFCYLLNCGYKFYNEKESEKETEYSELFKNIMQNDIDIHENNDWVLRSAAQNGVLSVTKSLIELGADIHALDDWALRKATKNGHVEVVHYLIDAGANIHTKNDNPIRITMDRIINAKKDYLLRYKQIKLLLEYCGAKMPDNNELNRIDKIDSFRELTEKMHQF
jgi:ankyrin repeat protein